MVFRIYSTKIALGHVGSYISKNKKLLRSCTIYNLSCANSGNSYSTGQIKPSIYNADPKESFKLVYKFTYIRGVSIISKAKLLQTLLTASSIPTSFGLYYSGIISQETVTPIIGIGLAAMFATYGIGSLFHRLVGFIYITPNCDKVKLSYINFWGKRVDDICLVDDIVPLSELSDEISATYINLRQYSSNKTLKLSLKYGLIKDIDLFRKIFGNTL